MWRLRASNDIKFGIDRSQTVARRGSRLSCCPPTFEVESLALNMVVLLLLLMLLAAARNGKGQSTTTDN